MRKYALFGGNGKYAEKYAEICANMRSAYSPPPGGVLFPQGELRQTVLTYLWGIVLGTKWVQVSHLNHPPSSGHGPPTKLG